jgi:hypothetical protein
MRRSAWTVTRLLSSARKAKSSSAATKGDSNQTEDPSRHQGQLAPGWAETVAMDHFTGSCGRRQAGNTKHVIKETENADYRFRTVASPRLVADAVARTVAQIDYPNFKNAVHGDSQRDRAYMRVWAAMHELQGANGGKEMSTYWDGKT